MSWSTNPGMCAKLKLDENLGLFVLQHCPSCLKEDEGRCGNLATFDHTTRPPGGAVCERRGSDSFALSPRCPLGQGYLNTCPHPAEQRVLAPETAVSGPGTG